MTYKELKMKQVGGSHYKKLDPQPWDFYRGFMSREAWKGYLIGNIIDYLVRTKNGLEDLKKAQHLLDVLVATEEEHIISQGHYPDRRTGLIDRRVWATEEEHIISQGHYPDRRTGLIDRRVCQMIEGGKKRHGRGRRKDDQYNPYFDLPNCKEK